jgi:hypothetical protein
VEQKPDLIELRDDQIGKLAEKIITDLYGFHISTTSVQSVLTTCFMNHSKYALRNTPSEEFQYAKKLISSILINLSEEINRLEDPKVARQGEDGESPTRPN